MSGAELIGTKQKLLLYVMPKGSAIYMLCTKPQSNFPNIFLNKLDDRKQGEAVKATFSS